MVIPYQISAPWWPLAMGAFRSRDTPEAPFAPCFKIRYTQAVLLPTGVGLRRMAILKSDVSSSDQPDIAQPCSAAHAHRGRASHFSFEDAEDSLRLGHFL